uniref:GLOBIN domain-containing protein n=1 Tax=Panagrellus redivivus TaxID=6233 RepID=A0A7E5A147_PANRE
MGNEHSSGIAPPPGSHISSQCMRKSTNSSTGSRKASRSSCGSTHLSSRPPSSEDPSPKTSLTSPMGSTMELDVHGRMSIELALSPRQARSSCNTPRHSYDFALRSPGGHDFRRKASIAVSSPSRHGLGAGRRMSVGEDSGLPAGRRMSRTAKLSLASKEDMMNSRRVSRAAIHFGETGDFGLTLVEQLKLSSYQILIIQQSWPKMRNTVFNNVFSILSQRNSKARELFQKMSIVESFSTSKSGKCCDMKEHVRALNDLVDFAVSEMYSPSKSVQDRCIQIGEAHVTLCGGNAVSVWDDLGACLTEAFSRVDAIRGKREAPKAWLALISFLVDSMRGGYVAQGKRKSITRNSVTGGLNFSSLNIQDKGQVSSNGSPKHCPMAANGNQYQHD